MEGNILPAKLPFTAVLLGSVLDNSNLINEHQCMYQNKADDSGATM